MATASLHRNDRYRPLPRCLLPVALLLGATVSVPAMADPFGRHHEWHGSRGPAVVYTHQGWHNGYWHHGHRDGRYGWWWVTGGLWYFYPRPVYPYPEPVYAPPAIAPQPLVPAPAPTPYWYYCPSAQAYYPYIENCPGPWQRVPAPPR